MSILGHNFSYMKVVGSEKSAPMRAWGNYIVKLIKKPPALIAPIAITGGLVG